MPQEFREGPITETSDSEVFKETFNSSRRGSTGSVPPRCALTRKREDCISGGERRQAKCSLPAGVGRAGSPLGAQSLV